MKMLRKTLLLLALALSAARQRAIARLALTPDGYGPSASA